MRKEAIAGVQVVWVVCPGCGEILPIVEATKTKRCPSCRCSLRNILCEYGVFVLDQIKNASKN